MSETATDTPVEPIAPPKPKRHARANKRRKPAPAAPKDSPFAGVTASQCCNACTAERCVISTVARCAHPFKTGNNGLGPITMANREKVRKLIKHEDVERRG